MKIHQKLHHWLNRAIRLITFVDLPIRKKFLLFSIGVLFWFLVIFVISLATLIDIDRKSTETVNTLIPHDRLAQKTTRKLQSLQVDATQIADADDFKNLSDKAGTAKLRIEDIRSFLTTLTRGGEVSDISRDNGDVIEHLQIAPVLGDEAGKSFVQKMSPLILNLESKLDELSSYKFDLLKTKGTHDEQLKMMLQEFHHQLHKARSISDRYSASAAQHYHENAHKITQAVQCTSTAAITTLAIATLLLALFTIWISRSMADPIHAMIRQIHNLGEGKVDLNNKITVSSKDEIGVLSSSFNGLMESIHGMTTYKKVIEEDDTIDDVYSRMGWVFRNTVGLNDFMIYEVGKNEHKMRPAYPLLSSTKDMSCNEEILVTSNLCRAKKTGHIVSSLSYPGVCKQFQSEGESKDHICIPMIIGGSTGGIVQFILNKSSNAKTVKENIGRKLFTAEQYIKESLSVLEAKKLMSTLRDSSVKDSLTGLYNRRFLQEYTETLVSGALRRGKDIGLIMGDLDYFKEVNDNYGHDVGDRVLRETASIIKESVRDSDIVLRFGGEEFLILLIDVEKDEAMSVSEKIRKNMKEKKIKVPDGVLTKTISLGVSEFPTDTQGFWQAIKFADVALYQAKQTGRNKTVRFKSEMWTEAEF